MKCWNEVPKIFMQKLLRIPAVRRGTPYVLGKRMWKLSWTWTSNNSCPGLAWSSRWIPCLWAGVSLTGVFIIRGMGRRRTQLINGENTHPQVNKKSTFCGAMNFISTRTLVHCDPRRTLLCQTEQKSGKPCPVGSGRHVSHTHKTCFC